MTKSRVRAVGDFNVTDSSGKQHTITMYVKEQLSQAGGVDSWYEADRFYKTGSGKNVGNRNHEIFNISGSAEWLPKD